MRFLELKRPSHLKMLKFTWTKKITVDHRKTLVLRSSLIAVHFLKPNHSVLLIQIIRENGNITIHE